MSDDAMPTMSEALIGAEAAQRLLADDMLQRFIGDLQANATQQALFNADAAEREAGRQIVVTLNALIGMLQAAVELPKTLRDASDRERAFE